MTSRAFTALLARRVREEREAQDLTQDQLADRAGVSTARLAHLEQGRVRNVTVAFWFLLAKGLKRDPWELVDWQGPVGPKLAT